MAVITVLDPLLLRAGSGLTERLAADHEVRDASPLTGAALLAALADSEVLLTAMAPVTAEMIAAAPRLGLIAKPGAGVDNIDRHAAQARGVLVCNAPGTRGQAVAEYVLFATLYLARQAWRDPSEWGRPPGYVDLAGRTLGLVGLGDIGSRVAAAAATLEMTVLASTPSRQNPRPEVPVAFVRTEELFRAADVVVLCMPLTDETSGLVHAGSLGQMPAGAILVNVARGACVVTADLEAALRCGHLGGAALDVTDPEPLPAGHGLRELPQVLVTPHLAGRTPRAQRQAVDVLLRNVAAFCAGTVPPHVVAPPPPP